MNVLPYIEKTKAELETLNTRHLLALYRRSRGSYYTCGCYYHCGDEWLNPDERLVNQQVNALHALLKQILDTREHVPTSAESKARTVRPHKEKKRMAYRR